MKYFLSLLAVIFSCNTYAQITIIDTPHCFYHGLHAEVTGGIVPTSSGITIDDGWSGVIPIGFTYNFYGIANTQCVIGSNGLIGFNLASAGMYNTWPISTTLAATTSADIRNVICGPWCDVFIPAGGTIEYSTQGVAPNRNFAVTWCGTRMYSCTSEWLTTQIVIFETSGIAEVHIGHRTICSTGWNGSRAIVGVKNPAGTVSTAAPLRDFAPTWTTSNEGWRFSPIAGPSYSVLSIPYSPIPYASSLVYWYDSATHAYLGSGPDIPVAPTVPTTYMAAVLGCNDTTKAYIHLNPPTGLLAGGLPTITGGVVTQPTVCGKCDGSIVLTGIRPHQIDTIFYSINGVPQPPRVDSALLDSTIHFNGLCAATYDYFYIKVGDCPSTNVGPFVLSTPPLHIDMEYAVKLGCYGDQVYFQDHSTPVGLEYRTSWVFDDGDSSNLTNVVHIYDQQGTYNVRLMYSTIYGCWVDTTFALPLLHPLSAAFTVDAHDVCLGMPIHFDGTTVSTDMPTFTWNFGNGMPEETTNPIDYTFPNAGHFNVTFTVKDSIGCDTTATDTINVISVTVRTSVHDTSVCLVDSMGMRAFAEVEPKHVAMSYSWTPTNNIGVSNDSMTNFFGIGTFVYTITVTTPPLILNPFGCSASDTEKINSYPPLTLFNVTPSQTIPYGSSIQLNAEGGVYYTWTPPDGSLDNNNINNPIATPRDSTTVYTVHAMNLWGCKSEADVTIKLDNDMPEGIPSAFTPNGDGKNDVFKITKLTFQNLVEFRVFNRWGQEMFMTNNKDAGWDGTFHGTPQDMGTYNWVIIVGNVDGTNKVYKGNVTLIR